MIRKINFTNYFSEFIHQVPIKFRFWKALQKKCFQSDIIFRHYVKMPPIKFWERLTKFMIPISLSEKFCCQNLITSIKVIKTVNNIAFKGPQPCFLKANDIVIFWQIYQMRCIALNPFHVEWDNIYSLSIWNKTVSSLTVSGGFPLRPGTRKKEAPDL